MSINQSSNQSVSQSINHIHFQMYARLRDKVTPNGFTFDQAIQAGVDNPGSPTSKTVGLVAGDEESYEVFKELFDVIIASKHGGYKPEDQHITNLNAAEVGHRILYLLWIE